jgi:probable phosphoglycerate mutase
LTTFLLIRHAAHTFAEGVLAGQQPGGGLSVAGQDQAAQLAERLRALPIRAVYTSPLARTRETADALAARLGLAAVPVDGFVEIDYGEWTGRRWEKLHGDARWAAWNTFRSSTEVPGGERMLAVQLRAVAALQILCREHPDQMVAVVSHGDVIKAVVAHYLGVHLDLFHRIEIGLASVSIVAVQPWGSQVIRLNDTGDLPAVA